MKRTIFSALILSCCSLFTKAQTTTVDHSNSEWVVQSTKAIKLGTTAPVRNLIPRDATSIEKKKHGKRNKKVPPNLFGFPQKPREYVEGALPMGEDPVRQKVVSRNTGFVVEPVVNVQGQSFPGPPDPTGDVGPDHYVHEVNTSVIEVFDKEGNSLETFASNTLWSQIGFSGAGDPIILYDQEVNRWIITEFTFPETVMLFAISEDTDPLGSYDLYSFTAPNFPDYPKYSIWKDYYGIATNEEGGETLVAYFLDKNAIINGEPEAAMQRITRAANAGGAGPGINVFAPVDWSGPHAPVSNNPIMLSMNDDAWGGSAEDLITVHTFDIDFEDSDNTTVTSVPLAAAPFDTDPCYPGSGQFGQCVPQAGGQGVAGIPQIIMNQVHYNNFITHESMVCCFTVDAEPGQNKAGIRWMEIRRITDEDWSIYQEGTYAPDDGFSRFVPSIAMDTSGNIGLVYSVSSPETFIELRFTGRRESDPLGEMTVEQYSLAEGSSTLFTGTRFGDYAHMSIDPSDGRTFWLTGEYAGTNNDGATRIAAFSLRRDTTDFGVVSLDTPIDSPDLTASEMVRMTIKNVGMDTQSVFQVGYIFEDQPAVINDITFELYPDSTYEHEFAVPVDMSVVGDYRFKLFNTLAGDQAIFNDTLRTVVSKLPRFDAGVTGVGGLGSTICNDSTSVDIIFTNFGTEPLTSVVINLELNGNTLPSINWDGNLATGESASITILLSGLQDGMNSLVTSTSMPSGMMDEIIVNDTFSRSFNAITSDAVRVIFELNTDFYPSETTWVLENEVGDVVESGGPYSEQATLFTEEWCLSGDQCYTFTIFDSYGDGICCGFGEGDYRLTDGEGNILAFGGEFADQESINFCLPFECLLTIEADISPESAPEAGDGAIIVTTANGVGPFQYSFDGGENFQTSNVFTNLNGGDYEVVVVDENACEAAVAVVVDILNSIEEVDEIITGVEVFPNPTDGVFRVNANKLASNDLYVNWQIFNLEGKNVQQGHLVKYDDTHTGLISLYVYPAGTYFLRIEDETIQRLIKIVKQ